MIEDITGNFFDLFVMMSLDGENYSGKICQPNHGIFDEKFIINFNKFQQTYLK